MATDLLAVTELVERVTGDINRVVSRDDWLSRQFLPEQVAARISKCGIFCELLRRRLSEEGVDAQQYIRNLNTLQITPGNKPRQSRHVTCLLEDKEYVADPTYGQFLGEYGVSYFALQHGKCEADLYPPERSVVFPTSEVGVVASWLRGYIDAYWRREGFNLAAQQAYLYLDDDKAWYEKTPKIYRPSDARYAELFFEQLWQLDEYEPHEPCSSVRSAADELYDQLKV